jgi:hypothetical protein
MDEACDDGALRNVRVDVVRDGISVSSDFCARIDKLEDDGRLKCA